MTVFISSGRYAVRQSHVPPSPPSSAPPPPPSVWRADAGGVRVCGRARRRRIADGASPPSLAASCSVAHPCRVAVYDGGGGCGLGPALTQSRAACQVVLRGWASERLRGAVVAWIGRPRLSCGERASTDDVRRGPVEFSRRRTRTSPGFRRVIERCNGGKVTREVCRVLHKGRYWHVR